VRANEFVEIAGGGGAEFLLAQSGVHLDHIAADLEFADAPGEVGAIAGVHPVAGGAGDKALIHGPDHEAVAGVTSPEGAVAIEDGDPGCGLKNEILELFGGQASNFELRGRQANLDPLLKVSNSIVVDHRRLAHRPLE